MVRLPGTVGSEALARVFNVTDRTVRRWAAEGTIPGRLAGGRRWEFDPDEVAAAVVTAGDDEEEQE